jgi:hypothetical protein
VRALADNVEPRRWLRFGAGSRTFQGTVTDDSFEIQRIISYRNSFLPTVRGTIQADSLGSSVSLTMRPSAFTLIFLVIWLAIAISGALASLASAPAAAQGNGRLVPVALVAFVWLMTMGGFYFEAAKAERALIRILKAARS